MSRTIYCPHCQKSFRGRPGPSSEKKVRCPRCSQPIPTATSLESESTSADEDRDLLVDQYKLLNANDLPPKAGKKKSKKKAEPPPPRRSLWRDSEGQPTPLLQVLRMTGAGLAAGLLAMTLWGVLIWITGLRLGFLAMATGLAIGLGLKWGGGPHRFGRVPSLLAASLTAILLTSGQLVATQVQARKYQAEFERIRERALPVITTDMAFKRLLADEIIDRRTQQEIDIDWSQVDEELRAATEEELLEHPDLFEALYPSDVWGEAEQLLEAYSPEDLEQWRRVIRSQWEQGPEAIDGETRRYLKLLKVAPQQFDWSDAGYFFLAVILSFACAGQKVRKIRQGY